MDKPQHFRSHEVGAIACARRTARNRVVRALVIVAVAGAAALHVVACGSAAQGAAQPTSDKSSPAQSSSSPTTNDAPPSGVASASAHTLTIATNETTLQVTMLPLQAKRLPAESADGGQAQPALYGVFVVVKNVGNGVYSDSIPACCVLIDNNNVSHEAKFPVIGANGQRLSGLLDSVVINPGEASSGWVYFALTKQQSVRMLQFTADSGAGPQSGQWSVTTATQP
ncbi:MAG: hypothetical protein ACLQUT_01905 [Thermoleophilia bacterium]